MLNKLQSCCGNHVESTALVEQFQDFHISSPLLLALAWHLLTWKLGHDFWHEGDVFGVKDSCMISLRVEDDFRLRRCCLWLCGLASSTAVEVKHRVMVIFVAPLASDA